MRQRILLSSCILLLGLTLAGASPSSEAKSGKVRAEMKGVDLVYRPDFDQAGKGR